MLTVGYGDITPVKFNIIYIYTKINNYINYKVKSIRRWFVYNNNAYRMWRICIFNE